MEPIVVVNGNITSKVSALDRGFSFGDGVFETIRLTDDHTPLWRYHLQRIQRGCQALRLPFNKAALEQNLSFALSTAREKWGEKEMPHNNVAKVILTRGVGNRGYQMTSGPATIVCMVFPGVPDTPEAIGLNICDHRLPLHPALSGIKHLNRLDNVLLKQECLDKGFSDGLVLDTVGNIIETTSSNIFFVRNQSLITPAIEQCGVDGTCRRFILERTCPELNIATEVATVAAADIDQFDSAFICNSVQGVVPVSSIGNTEYAQSDLVATLRREVVQQLNWDA